MTHAPLPTPRPISHGFELSRFQCGVTALDAWLRDRALPNESISASRSFIAATGPTVLGYYSLSAGSVEVGLLPGSVRRNMPSHVPAVLLGRLAVRQESQSRGLGRLLVRDAILRVLHAADLVGIRLLVCHPHDEEARAFYLRNAFSTTLLDPRLLIVDLVHSRRQLLDRWPSRVSEPPAATYG